MVMFFDQILSGYLQMDKNHSEIWNTGMDAKVKEAASQWRQQALWAKGNNKPEPPKPAFADIRQYSFAKFDHEKTVSYVTRLYSGEPVTQDDYGVQFIPYPVDPKLLSIEIAPQPGTDRPVGAPTNQAGIFYMAAGDVNAIGSIVTQDGKRYLKFSQPNPFNPGIGTLLYALLG